MLGKPLRCLNCNGTGRVEPMAPMDPGMVECWKCSGSGLAAMPGKCNHPRAIYLAHCLSCGVLVRRIDGRWKSCTCDVESTPPIYDTHCPHHARKAAIDAWEKG
jgi:hypothetical protein